MLAYVLAIAVALGSLSLYLAAFLLPEVHRKYDLVWSGVGLFYGLVLWVCAGRMTGGVLLGQVASVSLIGWFGWQTLKLRLAETVTAETVTPKTVTPISLASTVQERIAQFRQQLRQNPDTSSVLLNFDRLVNQTGIALDRLRIWIAALMSTTISEAESASRSASSPSAFPPPPAPPPPTSPPPAPLSPNTVRIEVETFSPDPLAETPGLAAEWSDLEFDNDPEMETIDDSLDSIPNELKRSAPRPDNSSNSSQP